MELENGKFYSPTKGELNFHQLIEEILNYISEKPELFYDIIVGCDSSSGEHPTFPVAIVIWRVGHGGRFFLKKISYKNKTFHNLKQRILEEVYLSCQLALLLKETLKEKISGKDYHYQLRYVHADIGENGITKDMIKEIIGLIKGNGFEAVIKPNSFAASVVADRFC